MAGDRFQTSQANRAIRRHASRQLGKVEPKYVRASRFRTYREIARLEMQLDYAARVREYTLHPDHDDKGKKTAREMWPIATKEFFDLLEVDGVSLWVEDSSELSRMAAASGESEDDEKTAEAFVTWDMTWDQSD